MDTAKNIIKNWIQILNAVVVEEINEKKKRIIMIKNKNFWKNNSMIQ